MSRFNLLALASKLKHTQSVPFSIYSCQRNQELRYVSFQKPILVLVLKGTKTVGTGSFLICKEGEFIFLSPQNNILIKNTPSSEEYMSIVVEFEFSDFDHFRYPKDSAYCNLNIVGNQSDALIRCVSQFIEWTCISPTSLWALRRKELLQLLYVLGYKQIASVVTEATVKNDLIDLFMRDLSVRLSINSAGNKLGMSPSTLRRRLSENGTSFRLLNTQVRLDHGLYLLQTTSFQIAAISGLCGYQSQSRFSEQFKCRYGITPLKLRRTMFE